MSKIENGNVLLHFIGSMEEQLTSEYDIMHLRQLSTDTP